MALIIFRQGLRAKLWVLVPPAVIVLVLADLSSHRFDPVFEAVPAAISTSFLVMTVVAVVVAVFFATYSIPAEMESKISYSVVTKPVGRTEIVAGKILGISLLILAAVGSVGLGAYVYIHIRADGIHRMAQGQLVERASLAAYPSDSNALESVATRGPLQTYRYTMADAGPLNRVDRGPQAKPSPPDVRWVLGEEGMRLAWRLTDTPIRDWAVMGQASLHLSLRVEPAPEAAPPEQTPGEKAAAKKAAAEKAAAMKAIAEKSGDEKSPIEKPVSETPPAEKKTTEKPKLIPLLISLQPTAGKAESLSSESAKPLYQGVIGLPLSGELDIPLAPPGRVVKGALSVPPEGELILEVAPANGPHVLGGGRGALRILGGQGKELDCGLPEIAVPEWIRRSTLSGRSIAPRAVAVYRFNNVAADKLGPGDAIVEAAFSLRADAPASVPPVGEITFIHRDGESRIVRFTPDGHRSTLLYVDREFLNGEPLEVRVACLTDDDSLGILPASIRFRSGGGPFFLNFLKGSLQVWLFGTVLAAIGVMVSARLSWFVSILVTAVFLLLIMVRDFVIQSTFIGYLAQRGDVNPQWIPDLKALLPSEAVSMGQAILAADMLLPVVMAAVVVGLAVAIGAILLKTREVAA